MLIIKLLYFDVLRKTFFPFMINIVELTYIDSLTPWFRIQKKTRMSSKENDTRYMFFPGFKVIIIDVTLLKCTA